MKYLIIPILQGLYLLSIILKAPFWTKIYHELPIRWDLTPNQAWLLPGVFNLLAAGVGVFCLWPYWRAYRKKVKLGKLGHGAAIACVVASGVLLKGAIMVFLLKGDNVAAAAKEMKGAPLASVVAAGEVIDGVYSNDVAGIQITLPEGWIIQSQNAIKRAAKNGARVADSQDGGDSAEITELPPGIYHLLFTKLYQEPHKSYNPSLVVTAFDKKIMAEVGFPTLESYVRAQTQAGIPYTLESGPETIYFGDSEGFELCVIGHYPQATVIQRTYAVESGGYYIILVASYRERVNYGPMLRSVRSLRVVD